MRTLADPGSSLSEAMANVPSAPGLYALHADPATWRVLGLEERIGDSPLYVGKAEDGPASRDIDTHFAMGRTGSSTVRRSFAALLREPLKLRAVPRNPTEPGYFDNFALEAGGEERLTEWMLQHLTLSTWPKPAGTRLRPVEVAVLKAWAPPMNLADVPRPSTLLKDARRHMADDARAWALANGYEL
jgi:hypothetical protein